MNPEVFEENDHHLIKIHLLNKNPAPNSANLQEKSLIKSLLSKPMHPFLKKDFYIYNFEKIEWAYREMINMGFPKAEILEILNSDEMKQQENNSKELIFNYVLLTILENQEKSKDSRSYSKENISLLIKLEGEERKGGSEIYEKNIKNQIKKVEEEKKELFNDEEKKQEICGICICPVERFEIIPKCKHRFCQECFLQYLQTTIENNSQKLSELPCPENNCKSTLKHSFIELKLKDDPNLLTKFQKFVKQAKFSKDLSYRQCIKPNCEFFVKKPFFGNKLHCECGQLMCFKCKKEWHEGLDCNQVYDREQNEQAFLKYQKDMGLRKCPKCNIVMDKYTGCNHITCTKCKHEFCWLCFRDWDKKTGYCPKGCEKFPHNNNDIPNIPILQIPEEENNWTFAGVNEFFTRTPDDLGSNLVLNFILFYKHRENFGISYYLLWLTYFVCQIIGFAITISIFTASLIIYMFLYLIWLIYFEERRNHFHQIMVQTEKFINILYFVIFSIYRLIIIILDNFLLSFMDLIVFWFKYIQWCRIQKNSIFLLAQMNYRSFKTFCILLDQDLQIYTRYNHAHIGDGGLFCDNGFITWFFRIISLMTILAIAFSINDNAG